MEVDVIRKYNVSTFTEDANTRWVLSKIRNSKEQIKSINIKNNLPESEIEIVTDDINYIFPKKNSEIGMKLKYRFWQLRLSNLMKRFNQNFKKKIESIYFVDKRNIKDYKDFMKIISILDSKNSKNILIVFNWELDDLEKFLSKNYKYLTTDNDYYQDGKFISGVPESLLYIGLRFKMMIFRIFITSDNAYCELLDIRESMNKSIELLSESEDALILINGKDIFTKKRMPVGFLDKSKYNSSLILGVGDYGLSNIFYENNIKVFNLDFASFLINFNLNLVSAADTKSYGSKSYLVLPGFVVPNNLETFLKIFKKSKLDKKCLSLSTYATNKVEIHNCHNLECVKITSKEVVFKDYFGFITGGRELNKKTNLSKNKKICLVLPPYSKASGGIVALYKLHDILLQKGFEVCVLPYNPTGYFPDFRGISIIFKDELVKSINDYIFIYSDTISSLPFEAEYQIRWCLNRPGNLPATSLGSFRVNPTYEFTYSSVITRDNPNKLFVSNFDFELFKPRVSSKKEKVCFYLGKSEKINIDILSKYYVSDSIIINRAYPDRRALPNLLASSSMLISFDSLSALNLEANLCGTPTLIITNKYSKFQAQDIKQFELPTTGLIFDINELSNIPKLDLDFYENFMREANELQHKTTSSFIKFISKI
jgi:hypothetical protein